MIYPKKTLSIKLLVVPAINKDKGNLFSPCLKSKYKNSIKAKREINIRRIFWFSNILKEAP